MDSIGWKRELIQLLDKVEERATESLTKINRRFMAAGLPFDDEFRKNVKKMANNRLESSFTKVGMSQWGARPPHGDNNRGRTTNDSKAQLKIFVELPKGTIALKVEPSQTIQQVKDKIQEAEGVRLGCKHLWFNSMKLDDNSTLSDNNIRNDSTLRLLASPR